MTFEKGEWGSLQLLQLTSLLRLREAGEQVKLLMREEGRGGQTTTPVARPALEMGGRFFPHSFP
jgi:hypothetical protein